ncbi:MAG: hypothetical protein IKU52_02200, partial [Clostridia bacterium]|nr:hypothetical protein [Clostridia bacterium]
LDTPIWIPTNIPKGYDLTYIDVAEYSEYKKAILIWSNEINRITYSVNFGLSNINTEEYNSINRNFVSKKGHEYIIVNVQNDLQAITIINNNYYSIKAPNKRILEKILNSMKFVN